MADDGKEEFAQLTGMEIETFGDHRLALHNSFATQIYLVDQGLRSCSVVWANSVVDFRDKIMALLETGSDEYLSTFARLETLGKDYPWCEPLMSKSDIQ